MFKGLVEHQLDDKNRLRIPSKFHKELVGELGDRKYCFYQGLNGCVCVMPESQLEEKLAPYAKGTTSKMTPGIAVLFGSVSDAEEDAQGRVVLPSLLRRMAGIKKDIVTLGAGDHLEIWAVEKYYEFINAANYDETLKELGI